MLIAVISFACIKAQDVVVYNQEDLDKELFNYCSFEAEGDDVDGVKKAIKKGANINYQDDQSGQTPLMGATLSGKIGIVKHLLDIGADHEIGEMAGYNPPHGAAFQGRADVMKALIEHGIDVNVYHKDGHNPLMRTCWGSDERHFETFKVLVEHGVDPMAPSQNDGKETCLDRSANDNITEFLNSWGTEL